MPVGQAIGDVLLQRSVHDRLYRLFRALSNLSQILRALLCVLSLFISTGQRHHCFNLEEWLTDEHFFTQGLPNGISQAHLRICHSARNEEDQSLCAFGIAHPRCWRFMPCRSGAAE